MVLHFVKRGMPDLLSRGVMRSFQAGFGLAVCAWVVAVGAPVVAGDAPDSTALETSAYLTLRPVEPPSGVGRPLSDFTINANEITLPAGGVRLWFELKLGGWAPNLLRTWQATISPASYSNGIGADLHPADEACVSSADCAALFGRGAHCSGDVCVPGWQDTSRDDFVVFGGISAVRTTSLEYAYGSTLGFDPPADQPVADDGTPRYGGTLVVDIPPDAAGAYEFRLRMEGATFMIASDGANIPIVSLPMRVILPSDCCFADGTCADAPFGCEATGGHRVASCMGDCDGNGSDDACELSFGTSDCNGNGVLDVCDVPWDADGDGFVTPADYGQLFACLHPPCGNGSCPGYTASTTNACCNLADVDGDGDADLRDFAQLELIMGTQGR